MINQDEIDAIKSYVDVAPFMQASGVELTRIGRGYKGYCPFHEDNKSPSLSVTPGKNLWKCFGCGKGGDIIEFVQLFDRVDFKAAVEKLATYLPGGDLPVPEVKSQRTEDRKTAVKKENPHLTPAYIKVLSRVIDFYHTAFCEDSRGREYLEERGVESLVKVKADEDPFSGGVQLIQTYGIGALVPNTILLGDTRELTHHGPYCAMIEQFYQARRNVVIVRDDEKVGFASKQSIDVWWGGLRKNGALMMILAYLISQDPEWQKVSITVKMMVPSEAAAHDAESNLSQIIDNMRIPFQHKEIVNNQSNFWTLLKQESQSADLIMLGLAEPNENFLAYYEQLSERTQGLPTTMFVLASQEIAFEEILL